MVTRVLLLRPVFDFCIGGRQHFGFLAIRIDGFVSEMADGWNFFREGGFLAGPFSTGLHLMTLPHFPSK